MSCVIKEYSGTVRGVDNEIVWCEFSIAFMFREER